ncbi:DUF1206 domain-containing protein [Oryzobacter telluris]|uniref:DUF1206 domain-containing protein n=1 Tax=Oryzobacter telluris TaxID=3149179 RepID=UPI00370D702E
MSGPDRPGDTDDGSVVEAVVERAEDFIEDAGEAVVERLEDVREKAGEVVEGAGEAAQAFAQVTSHAAEVAETHPTISTGARIGFLLDGVLHVAMGWAGLGIAWGWGGTADESGALTTLADTVGGRWALWIGFVGFSVVALWNLARAITGRHCKTGFKRLEHGADGLAYVTVAWSAAAFAIGSGQSSRESTVSITRSLLALPGGTLLVVITGLAVGGVGAFSFWTGWTGDFLVDLERHPGRLAEVAGRIGFVMRGVAFALVGYLFIAAAWTQRAEGATGIDGALRFLQAAPLGRYELSLISVGLMLFGVYLVTRARHLRR